MWRRGSISPLVDLLCDDCAAEGAALLPVEPHSDAFVTEYVLHSGEVKAHQHILHSKVPEKGY